MIDADEIARLREEPFTSDLTHALLDELEKARGDLDELTEENRLVGEQMQKCASDNDRLEAERDSACALLREADAWHEAALGLVTGEGLPNWDGIREHRTRIAMELGQ